MQRPAEHPSASRDVADAEFIPVMPDVADLIGILRRGWWLIAAATVGGLLVGLIAVKLMAPVYKASARLLIEKSVSRYMQSNKLIDEPMIDDSDLWNQIHIITSESILLPVIRQQGLDTDVELVGAPRTEPVTTGFVARVKGLFGWRSQDGSQLVGLERIAFESALKRLTVAREDGPKVINITYESRDPEKAANIANAIAEGYLASTLDSKVSSARLVGKIMQERLSDLKTQAANAERTLLEFKMANNLVSSTDKTLSSEQLNSLNTHLANARVEMAEAKARLDRVEMSNDVDGRAAFTQDNDLISKLRSQYLDLSTVAADLEASVGKDHPATAKNRKRMEQVRAAIIAEQKRIFASYNRDYELAKARYEQLATSVSQALEEQSSTSGTQARLHELESSAETLRTLYNNMLQRASETNKTEAQPQFIPDARIITRASRPLQTEPSKKRLLLVFAGSALGLALGLGLVLLRDLPLGVFRTPRQVLKATGVYCATLPALETPVAPGSPGFSEHVLERPFSRFAETLRTVAALTTSAKSQSGAKVFCVISSVPKEGKTTVAANLSCILSNYAGVRTLLIDADLHRHSLTNRMAPDAELGIREVMDDPELLSRVVVRRRNTNLDILACPIRDRVPNATELLGSPKMKKLVEAARQSYDLVIIEVAPLASLADARMIAEFCDKFIFVVEWGKTSQRLVLESLSDVAGLWENTICFVLNKADPAALKSVEFYKGQSFKEYYQDEPSVTTSTFAKSVG